MKSSPALANPALGADVPFHSPGWRRATLHTLSFVLPVLRPGDAILDVGCGHGYIPATLVSAGWPEVTAIDVFDARRVPLPRFQLFDGLHLPFEDRRFDVVMLNFVLHHVPNEKKPVLLGEVRRVARRAVVILEDTPQNFIDRWVSDRHGDSFRKEIGSSEPYGFYTKEEWDDLLPRLGFKVVRSERIGRLSRGWRKPHARSVFVVEVGG